MGVDVQEEPIADLKEYSRIPIAFEVRLVLEIEDEGAPSRSRLGERALDDPYEKDYDAAPGASPVLLPARFDVTNWAVLAAWCEGVRVGGAILAFDTPGVAMLEGRRDLAVLWDLRVSPEHRGRGVGTALFSAAEAWAFGRGCRQLKVETQDVNVPACRFYARRGCVLESVRRFAYPELPGEVQLLWTRDLSRREYDHAGGP